MWDAKDRISVFEASTLPASAPANSLLLISAPLGLRKFISSSALLSLSLPSSLPLPLSHSSSLLPPSGTLSWNIVLVSEIVKKVNY